ncbi:MAG: AAA family ATPase [Sulfurimonadaceae bacterium]|jgi:predicted ATP-binding protein involved in virulence
MKLLNIKILRLFNIFDHDIDLNQEERITIITAPNGYGKTIALKTIYSLFNKKFTFFNKLIFDSITYTFDNNQSIEIHKKTRENEQKIEFYLKENSKTIESFEYPSKKIMKNLERSIPSHLLEDFTPPFIRRIRPNEWLNELTHEILSIEDVLYQFSEYIPEHMTDRLSIEIPVKISEIFKTIEVYFIQEQRLVLREPISDHRMRREIVITDTIEKYSQELSKLIKQKIGEYAQITQSLDSSFPKRLFQQNSYAIEADDLKNRLNALQEKRQKISEYGLLKVDDDTSMFSDENIKETDTKVLSLYLADNEQKLSVFDTLVNKIELFTEILNNRRFNFKSIEIDKEKGFIFKTANNTLLKLTDLSSGEQHEAVLLYELLFKAKENSLVLIDEPEISLHVVWQKAFLDDIQEIINLQKIDVVIATHSPQIINDRWELTVNLEASVGTK